MQLHLSLNSQTITLYYSVITTNKKQQQQQHQPLYHKNKENNIVRVLYDL